MTLDLLTPAEVASLLRLSKASIYRLAVEGELPSFRLRGKRRTRAFRFSRSEVEDWLQKQHEGKR